MDTENLLAILDLPAAASQEIRSILTDFTALSPAGRNNARTQIVDKIFPLVFGDDAATSETAAYETLRKSPWSTNCYLSPHAIVTPSSAAAVAKVLALCRFLDVQFSIRSGGHLQNPGFTSNEGGVVISMSKLTDLTLSKDGKTADIGLGLRWLDVYKGLEEQYGVTVTGGRVPTVGVGGLLLGGGLSFQNSEHGLSCMGVEEYEVVLADSTIIKANPVTNSDLFWALKGGGPNFGIVTKAKMATVSSKVWAEGRVYSPAVNGRLLDALMKYHEVSETDKKASLVFQSVNEATVVVFFYCAPMDNPPVFQCFHDIPFLAHLLPPGCRSVYDVVEGFASLNPMNPKCHEMRTMSSLPDLEVYQAAEQCRLKQVEAIKDVPGALLTMVIQPLSTSMIEACHAKGGTPLGLNAQNHQWLLLMADWSDPSDEPIMREACRAVIEEAENVAKRNGTYLPFVYSNYASRDQDPLASYGAGNVKKLKEIAQKYDPDGVFQRLQYNGWLLSRSLA